MELLDDLKALMPSERKAEIEAERRLWVLRCLRVLKFSVAVPDTDASQRQTGPVQQYGGTWVRPYDNYSLTSLP